MSVDNWRSRYRPERPCSTRKKVIERNNNRIIIIEQIRVDGYRGGDKTFKAVPTLQQVKLPFLVSVFRVMLNMYIIFAKNRYWIVLSTIIYVRIHTNVRGCVLFLCLCVCVFEHSRVRRDLQYRKPEERGDTSTSLRCLSHTDWLAGQAALGRINAQWAHFDRSTHAQFYVLLSLSNFAELKVVYLWKEDGLI